MIKLSKEQFDQLLTYSHNTPDLGYICEYGACVGDAKWVLKEENSEYFLAHISEFILWEEGNDFYLVHKSEIESNGILLKLKKEN